MAKFDLNELELDELKKLQKALAKAIDEREARRRKDALAAASKAAKDAGFSLEELIGVKRRHRKVKAPAGLKYRHPENPKITWSGRGRRPAWIADALVRGKSLKRHEID